MMQAKLSDSFAEPEPAHSEMFIDLEGLAVQIGCELGGQVSYAQILEVVIDVAAEFHSASVITHLPILIRRETCKRLQEAFAERRGRG